MNDARVTLETAHPTEFTAFKRDLQAAFAVAIVAEFGALPDGPIPSDGDLDGAMTAPGTIVLHVVSNGQRVGGAVVTIDPATQRNSLDLFFIAVDHHGQGLGEKAWFAIEAMFPKTTSWQTVTPYFEKRNIHFYVNKCGFHIVEFYNERRPDPHAPGPAGLPDGDEAFRFQKEMRPRR